LTTLNLDFCQLSKKPSPFLTVLIFALVISIFEVGEKSIRLLKDGRVVREIVADC